MYMKKIFAVTGIALLLASIICLFPATSASAHAASVNNGLQLGLPTFW
jgi:hypothetical protein